MNFGLTFEKLLVIGVIAALLIGPERLPQYAEALAKMIRKGSEFLRGAKSRVQEEMGPELDDLDWRKLDPRRYDPRRIIRDALLEDTPPAAAAAAFEASPPRPPGPTPRLRPRFSRTQPPPFDSEAT